MNIGCYTQLQPQTKLIWTEPLAANAGKGPSDLWGPLYIAQPIASPLTTGI